MSPGIPEREGGRGGEGLDGLVLYDIDDENDRNPEQRPFPFLPTIDPADYRVQHLRVPFGVNVESVSIRLAEIEASVDLAREIAREFRR